MYCYAAYGLGIHSEIPLPSLGQSPVQADVTIRLGKLAGDPSEGNGLFLATAEQALLRFDWVGAFHIKNGSTIVVDPIADVNEHLLQFVILGIVFAILLHQRGRLVLHASAVTKHGAGIAFLGAPGWGKSTTAAALLGRAYELVADDVVAVSLESNQRPMITPAFPLLKIWPEAGVVLGKDISQAPRVSPEIEKRAHHLSSGFTSTAVPLSRIYVLAEGALPAIEDLPPHQAFIELVRHTFVAHLLGPTATAPEHFQQCTRLLRQIPVRRLARPQSLDSLSAIADLVERDLFLNSPPQPDTHDAS